MTTRVLVVEDDPAIQELIRFTLEKAGLKAAVAASAEEALTALKAALPDVVLIDWMLPKMSGLALARQLREAARTEKLPLIMVTARGEEADRVAGLEQGADDYLVKPFSPRELLARIQAVLRRGAAGAHHEPDRMVLGDLELDTIRRRAFRAGTRLDLTAQEYTLLSVLLRHRGEVMSRTVLTELVWDMNFDGDSNVVEVAIRRLRSKLDEPFPTKLLHTVRGMGYVLELDRGNDTDA